jgi:hypothetical protein
LDAKEINCDLTPIDLAPKLGWQQARPSYYWAITCWQARELRQGLQVRLQQALLREQQLPAQVQVHAQLQSHASHPSCRRCRRL